MNCGNCDNKAKQPVVNSENAFDKFDIEKFEVELLKKLKERDQYIPPTAEMERLEQKAQDLKEEFKNGLNEIQT